ncbi:DUF1877 family protein [Streptomyces sp. M10(2022)]
MIGRYARLTPAELDRALREPDWAKEFVVELMQADWDGQPEASAARCLDTEKAWHALSFLLDRIEFPIDIVYGEEEIPGPMTGDSAPLLPPSGGRSRRSRGSRGSTCEPPGRGVSAADLALAGVYPVEMWERGESLDYVTSRYQALVPFFRAAAREGTPWSSGSTD